MGRFYFQIAFVVCTLVMLSACGADREAEIVGEPSQAVRLGAESSSFLLSANFARQIEAFDLKFGDFSLAPDFLGLPYQSTRIEILQDGLPLMTAFELQLPADLDYEAFLELLKAERGLTPAIFGSSSFYFLQNGYSINLLPFGDNVLAFRFTEQGFEQVRDFIASLLIFR